MEPLKKVQVEGFLMYAEPEVLFGNLDELCSVSTISFCKFQIIHGTILCIISPYVIEPYLCGIPFSGDSFILQGISSYHALSHNP